MDRTESCYLTTEPLQGDTEQVAEPQSEQHTLPPPPRHSNKGVDSRAFVLRPGAQVGGGTAVGASNANTPTITHFITVGEKKHKKTTRKKQRTTLS